MLILIGLIAAVVLGWILLGPRILPPSAPSSSETGLDGRWTTSPAEPMGTTLVVDGTAYTLSGSLPFTGSGRVARDGEHLLVTDDGACPDAVGRYAVELGEVDRTGLLPQHRAQTMTLTAVEDPCPSRASALGSSTWTLRASGRDGVYGICDPPNEEAAITGHWPVPSGCG
jgi:hypothetical protein